jgi:hypothetical protein
MRTEIAALGMRSRRVALVAAVGLAATAAAPAGAQAAAYDGGLVCVQVNGGSEPCTSGTQVNIATWRNVCPPYDVVCRADAIADGTSVTIGTPRS